MSELATLDKPLTILGDFNIHVNKPSKAVSEFLEISDLFNLNQCVTSSTHNLGNTLDLVLSNLPLRNLQISDPAISDHYLINFECEFPFSCSGRSRIPVIFRKLNDINFDSLNSDLASALPSIDKLPLSPDSICSTLTTALAAVLNSHAPLITRTVSSRPDGKWFSDSEELTNAKRLKRACERWRKKSRLQNRNDLPYASLEFKSATKSYYNLLHLARGTHSTEFYTKSKNRSKTLFNQFEKHSSPPTSQSDPVINSDSFANFFIEKIDKIRSNIVPVNGPKILPDEPPHKLYCLSPVSGKEIRFIITSSNKSYSPADPFPSKLIVKTLPVFLPYITHLINSSFYYGVFPQTLKHAFVKPLLKKANLDPREPQNYRPISQLPFFAKIIEKAATSQLLAHMSTFLTSEIFQSGFKKFHSTETALLCISNDLRRSSDAGEVSILIQLDLSSAFDTLDHPTLTETLQTFIGISDTALSWFSSYISNRTQQVQQPNDTSKSVNIKHGVPQGSVPGPNLFRVYIIPLLILLTRLGIKFHIYADDTQFYISCLSGNFKLTMETVQLIYTYIANWLNDNFLKLNDSKSQVIIIGTPTSVDHCKSIATTIKLGDSEVPFSSKVTNLGVIFDESLSFYDHIKNCRKNSFYILRNLRHIRHHFTKSGFETLIHAFITSKIDYCNSLFINIPKSTVKLLQSVQNFAARLVCRRSLHCHITPVLMELHWLPVAERIDFKTLLITYKVVHFSVPEYLASVLHLKNSVRDFRNHDHLLLEEPRSHSARMGDRAFSIHAPKLWNKIPFAIRSSASVEVFKKNLKTHLFIKRFT